MAAQLNYRGSVSAMGMNISDYDYLNSPFDQSIGTKLPQFGNTLQSTVESREILKENDSKGTLYFSFQMKNKYGAGGGP